MSLSGPSVLSVRPCRFVRSGRPVRPGPVGEHFGGQCGGVGFTSLCKGLAKIQDFLEVQDFLKIPDVVEILDFPENLGRQGNPRETREAPRVCPGGGGGWHLFLYLPSGLLSKALLSVTSPRPKDASGGGRCWPKIRLAARRMPSLTGALCCH